MNDIEPVIEIQSSNQSVDEFRRSAVDIAVIL